MMVTRIGSKRRRSFVGLGLSASCRITLCSPSRVSGSTSMPTSIAPTWQATFLWGSGLPSEPYGSSASCMTARLRLPLLLAGVRNAFFRSVSCSPCLLDLKTPVPKLARGTEACVPEDSASDSPTSAPLMQFFRLVLFVVLPLLVVLDEVVRFAAAADNSGWWPSELCPSSLPADPPSEPSGGGPRLSPRANLISAGGGVLSSVSFLRWQQKSRSISLLGGFKDHHMRTSHLFVIWIM